MVSDNRSAGGHGFLSGLMKAKPAKPGEVYGVPGQGESFRISAVVIVLLISFWAFVTYAGYIKPLFLPSPMGVVSAFFDVMKEGFTGVSFWEHIWVSTLRVFGAFLLACVIGIPLGIAMGMSPVARGIFDPPIEFYRPIPPLAYLPLMIIWFGIDELSKVLLIFSSVLAPMVLGALCRFVWNATLTVQPSGGHPSTAFPASGKGASRPLPSWLPAKKPMADNPLASVTRCVAASRPGPSGGLRPALTRPQTVSPRAALPGDGTVAFHTKRRGTVLGARAGVKSAAIEQIHAAYSFGATRWQVIRMVILPSAMPEIFTAMRVGIGFGWTTLVAAEMVAATSGLGYMVLSASRFLQTPVVIMGIVVIAAIAYAFDHLVRFVERRVVPWKGRG